MSLFDELKRRNVFRVAIAYLALAWLIIESSSVLLPGFGIPDWAFRFVVIILAIGFVPALLFSWAYEVTPEGLQRESEVIREDSITHITARRLDILTISLVVLALAILVLDRVILNPAHLEQATASSGLDENELAEPASAPHDSIDSIAVLPFVNRSANPDDAFFVDGIHDDLLTHISQINSLKTISRTSVMQYRNSSLSVPDIAAELGVAVILEGGVQRAGEQVRINVQLIDAHTDDHLWAEIYDRQLTASNIFAIQSEIAQSVAAALEATLTPIDKERISNIPTSNLDALESYFLGRQSMSTRRVADLRRAAEYLEEATTIDPEFALAFVNLADTYLLLYGYGDMSLDESLGKSAVAAERALTLDPGLGAAHASVAKRRHWSDDYEGAESSFRRAIDLSPNYAPAFQWYAEMLRDLDGRMEEALAAAMRAVQLDPKSAIIVNDYAETLEFAGRLDEALASYRESIEIEPRLAPGYASIGRILAIHRGQLDNALAQYEVAFRLEPEDLNVARLIGLIFNELGDWRQAEAWFGRTNSAEYLPTDLGIAVEIRRGNSEAALAAATDNFESPPVWQASLRFLRDRAITDGDLAGARQLYQDAHPELFDLESLNVGWLNREAAVELAFLLLLTGEQEHADQLLDGSEAAIALGPIPWTTEGFAVLQTRIDVLRGDNAAAISSLRQALDSGWRLHARYFFEVDPVLAPLRDDQEFQRLKSEFESDMAEQLERVRRRDLLTEWQE